MTLCSASFCSDTFHNYILKMFKTEMGNHKIECSSLQDGTYKIQDSSLYISIEYNSLAQQLFKLTTSNAVLHVNVT